MAHVTTASLSVHHFISTVGSDAGFASIIGLAILVLLYFAQARETSTLRDRADEAEERSRQLEVRLAQVARSQAAPQQRQPGQPQQRAAARPLVNPPPAASMRPATAGAGAGAAAGAGQATAGAATGAGPATGSGAAPQAGGAPAGGAPGGATPAGGAPGGGTPGGGTPGGGTPAGAAPQAGGAPGGGAAQQGAPAQPVVPAGPPAGVGAPPLAAATRLIPVAAAAPQPAPPPPAPMPTPTPTPEPAFSQPATVAGGNGSGYEDSSFDDSGYDDPAHGMTSAQPLPRVQLRPGGAAASGRPGAAASRRQPPPRSSGRGRSRAGRGFTILLTALVVVAVIAVLLIATGGSGKQNRTGNSTPTTNAPTTPQKTKPTPFRTSSVTVAVLNGTATAGLAARISSLLGAAGYKDGSTGNAANQTETTTSVAYLPGQKRDALAVARTLKLSSAAVTPVDQSTQSLACPPPGSCSAQVVVTVGADLANK